MSPDIIARVTHLINEFDARVQVAADCWSNQSPCAEWKARDVVAHVGNNLFGVSAGLRGQEGRKIDADDDIVTAWAEARDGFLATLPTADLTQQLPGPFGPMSAQDLIGQLICTDVLVHTWDLARAIGGDEHLDADAVAGSYAGIKPLDQAIRGPGMFGAKVEPAVGADMQTEFLNFLGRTV